MKGAQISWAILHGHKTIENRSMRIKPGWYLLHTGKGSQSAEHQQWMRSVVGSELPAEAALPHGVIVGALLIVRSLLPPECGGSVWASGPITWPERSGPRGIGIHHAGAELEPAKGDSGVKR